MHYKPFKSLTFTLSFLIIIFIQGFADTVATENAEVGKWTMDYDKALELASQKGLPVLINFTGSDWCGWCKLMDKSVFAKEAWKDYAKENIVLITLDFPRNQSIVPAKYKARNEALKKEYGVTGYPTYFLLDEDGKTILGKLGAGRNKTPESFIQEVKQYLKYRDVEIEKYTKTLSVNDAETYKAAMLEFKTIEKELTNWLDTRPLATDENKEIYQKYSAQLNEARQKINDLESSFSKKATL